MPRAVGEPGGAAHETGCGLPLQATDDALAAGNGMVLQDRYI
jgi:hypothetical protein